MATLAATPEPKLTRDVHPPQENRTLTRIAIRTGLCEGGEPLTLMLPFVAALQARHSAAVGFLPIVAINSYLERRQVIFGFENDDPAGYVLWRPSLRTQPHVASIVQAAVCLDAQRRGVGLAAVDALIGLRREAGTRIVQAWCAEDLEANEFWAASGFERIASAEGGRQRGRVMILWRRPIVRGVSAAEIGRLPDRVGWKARKLSNLLKSDRPIPFQNF